MEADDYEIHESPVYPIISDNTIQYSTVQYSTIQYSETKANWIDRNQLKCVIKENIGHMELTGRRGGRRKQLLDGLKDNRGYRELKEETPNRTLWRTCCRRGYGSIVRQTAW